MVHRKYLFTIVGLLILFSCSSSLWDELPGPISEFLSTYYPSSTISSYSEHNGEYYVTVKNGASLTFDSNYHWTLINGNGEVLPQVFLYDQLPPALYQYIESLEALDDVYVASNNARNCMLTLKGCTVDYIYETGKISEIRMK